jgi:hypothetical protein
METDKPTIESGYYKDDKGEVHFMSWFTDYGMEVFQPVPDRKPVDTTGLVSTSLEEAVKDLVRVGPLMFATKASMHIQFDKPPVN